MIEMRVSEQDKLLNKVYDAKMDFEKTKAYNEGYMAALEHCEKLLHDFRTGVRSM